MRGTCIPNGPELKYRVGVSALASFSSFSQGWGARELRGAPGCFTGVRESSRGRTERLSIPPRGLEGSVRARSWRDETEYLRGQRMGERGGKRDGLRMERNSSSASEGKLDLIRKYVNEENKGAGRGWEGVGREDGSTFTLAMRGEILSEILTQGPSERVDHRPRGSQRRTICPPNQREWKQSDGDDVGGGARGDEWKSWITERGVGRRE
jgi:hypothetical protein